MLPAKIQMVVDALLVGYKEGLSDEDLALLGFRWFAKLMQEQEPEFREVYQSVLRLPSQCRERVMVEFCRPFEEWGRDKDLKPRTRVSGPKPHGSE